MTIYDVDDEPMANLADEPGALVEYGAAIANIADERLRREIDELRAEMNNLAHRLNEAITNLQTQLYDKVNAEPKFQP